MCVGFEKALGDSYSNNTAGAGIRILNFCNKNHDLEKAWNEWGVAQAAWKLLKTGWNRATVGGK